MLLKERKNEVVTMSCNGEDSHDFVLDEGNEDWHIRGCGKTLKRDIVCQKCGLKAREVWVFSCFLDENDKEV